MSQAMEKEVYQREKIASHALFVDFSSKTPVQQCSAPFYLLFHSVRRGIENLLVEVRFIGPYLLTQTFQILVFLEKKVSRPLIRLVGSPWLVPLLLGSLWLFN